MEPRHNSGYALGVIKLVEAPLADFYKLHVEFTNMTPGFIQEVRPQNYYYTNEEIRQGHTNRGHLLGAAIGPGSNPVYQYRWLFSKRKSRNIFSKIGR